MKKEKLRIRLRLLDKSRTSSELSNIVFEKEEAFFYSNRGLIEPKYNGTFSFYLGKVIVVLSIHFFLIFDIFGT